MKTFYLIFILIGATFSIGACHDAKPSSELSGNEAIPVKVAAVDQHLAQQEIHASGQFTTNDETFLSFKTGGIIRQMFVKEGDVVRKGQIVATLHQNEIDAQVQQAKISYEKALRDFNRYSNLYTDSVVTLEQLQNTKTTLEISRQQLNSIRFNQNYSVIRATASGYILKKLASPGQLVNAGDPVFQINGAHQSPWILKVAVSDKEWSAVEIGNTAKVYTDAMANQTLEAIVAGKTSGADPLTGTFTIELQLKEKQPKSIGAGLFGKAVIYPSTKLTAWSVPYDALIDGDAGEAYVFASNDLKTATKVKVKVASVSKGMAIISSGLETTKTLVISGSAYLRDGSAITIIKTK